MIDRCVLKVGRRDFFRLLLTSVAATATNGPVPVEAADFPDRQRARYHRNSCEVQTFYRVNRYSEKSGRVSC
jgi:hypothetical protein